MSDGTEDEREPTGERSPDVVYEFGHSTRAPREARRALEPVLPSDLCGDDIGLVASELVTNVVRHTPDGGELRAWDHDPFRLEVEDTSPVIPEPAPGRDIGGQGLAIVDALASHWGAAPVDDGKVVWAEFERHPDTARSTSIED